MYMLHVLFYFYSSLYFTVIWNLDVPLNVAYSPSQKYQCPDGKPQLLLLTLEVCNRVLEFGICSLKHLKHYFVSFAQ